MLNHQTPVRESSSSRRGFLSAAGKAGAAASAFMIIKPELARGGTEICRLDPRDGSCEPLLRNEPGVWDFRASESPDGRLITFCRAKTGEAPALWVMNADGGEARQLTGGWEDRGADHPRWLATNTSPDS